MGVLGLWGQTMTYQPVRKAGQWVGGERPSDDRYAMVREVIEDNEPDGAMFSVLDIGTSDSYFPQRIIEDFPDQAFVTGVDVKAAKFEHEQYEHIQKRTSARTLWEFERYDYVLCLSVIHHFANWPLVLKAVQACRVGAVVEVPHPSEDWMEHSAARHQLAEIDEAVSNVGERLGESPRTGRNGVTYKRPVYWVPGGLSTFYGQVVDGKGACSQRLTSNRYGRGISKVLGFQPYPGSLNIECPELDTHHILAFNPKSAYDWTGEYGEDTARYLFWDAWVLSKGVSVPCKAMIPERRGNRAQWELVSEHWLRDLMELNNGDNVRVDVMLNAW